MFGFNKRKKKIIALEALLKSSAKVAFIQKAEIKSLERANNRLLAENETISVENSYYQRQISDRDSIIEHKIKKIKELEAAIK